MVKRAGWEGRIPPGTEGLAGPLQREDYTRNQMDVLAPMQI